VTDILDTIDAATGALCACGCARPLDPDGPSAWWATEDCQQTWQSGRPDLADFHAALSRVFEAYAAAIRDWVAALSPVVEAFEACAEQPRRNTGPAVRQRPPRRIDPRRAR
jgi:hypothetical protein